MLVLASCGASEPYQLVSPGYGNSESSSGDGDPDITYEAVDPDTTSATDPPQWFGGDLASYTARPPIKSYGGYTEYVRSDTGIPSVPTMTAPTSTWTFGPQGRSPAPRGSSQRKSLPGGFNAVVTVVCLSISDEDGKEWSGPVSWNGPLNARYKFRFEPADILMISVIDDDRDWDDLAKLLMSFQIHTDAKNPAAGKSIRRFCGSDAAGARVSVAPSQAATDSNTTGGIGHATKQRPGKSKPRTSRQTGTDPPSNGSTGSKGGYQRVQPTIGPSPFSKPRDRSKDKPYRFGPPPEHPDYPGRLPDVVIDDQHERGKDKGKSPGDRQHTGTGTHGKPTSGPGSAAKQSGKFGGAASARRAEYRLRKVA